MPSADDTMPREPDRPDTIPATTSDARDDDALLAQEYADVRPITREPREPPPRVRPDRDTLARRRQAATEHAPQDDSLSGSIATVATVAPDAYLEFHRPGLQLRQVQKLRKGQLPWQIAVDLHGVTRAEALAAVERLIRQAREERVNCVRIVHGKGQGSDSPTIKADLNHWLRRHDQVLAFCSALPADGGTGALYVLLRRTRD